MTSFRVLIVVLLFCLPNGLVYAEQPAKDARESFTRGIVELERQKQTIFPEYPRVHVMHRFKPDYPDTKSLVGFVRLTMRRTKDSEHLEEFTFKYREQKWVLVLYCVAATIDGAPPKVSITKKLTEETAQKVQACFR